MNILQICSARKIGGGERHLVDLVRGLLARDENVFAAVARHSPLIDSLMSLPAIKILETPMRNSLDMLSAMRIAQFARERSVDVIHAHAARDYLIAAFASRSSGGIPSVLTRHVLFPMSPLHRITLRHVSRVIAVSTAVAHSLRQQGIFEPDKIVTIPNGIDVEHFAACTMANAPAGRFRVGIIGHLSPVKGQQDLLRAAAEITTKRDNIDFVIVGEDKSRSRENRTSVERLVEELHLTDRVSIIGWLDDVREVLGTLDVCVSASRSEPFGLAIVEAMAAGIPVVATATDGATEIVEDGRTGCIVPIGDVSALAEAIDGLLADEGARERLRTNALEMVRERFSVERMVTETKQVYSTIVRT